MSVSVSASIEQSADNIYTEIWTPFLICWCWCCRNISDHINDIDYNLELKMAYIFYVVE